MQRHDESGVERMLKLKSGWRAAKRDVKVMNAYVDGEISLDSAIEMIAINNECDCSSNEFRDLLWRCGYYVAAYEFKKWRI